MSACASASCRVPPARDDYVYVDWGREFAAQHNLAFAELLAYFAYDAFGALGMRVTDKEDLVEAFKTALAEDGPVLVDVHVTKEENCYPMIPAGQAARDMVG